MKNIRILELRAAEGGADSRQFTAELASAYHKLALQAG